MAASGPIVVRRYRRPGRPGTRYDVWTARDGRGKVEEPRASPMPPSSPRGSALPPATDAACAPAGAATVERPGGERWATNVRRTREPPAGEPAAGRPAGLRNVVLVGHSGSGKTTLVEALARATGALSRGGPGRGRRLGLRLRRDRAPPAALRTAVPGPAGLGGRTGSTCWTPPGTRTSSGSCGPDCGRRTRRCSSSRPPTGWTARPGWCGTSAPRWACRGPSW